MIQLSEAQQSTVNKCRMILYERGVVYLAAQPRTGKSPMSIMLAKISGWKRIAIITKKNAIPGIQKFTVLEPSLQIDIKNFERIKELDNMYDGYIIDEAHAIGAYPKPSARAKDLKALIGNKPVILMSGTPTPESHSQIYHQFWITPYSPFRKYANFYKFAKELVNVTQEYRNGWMVNNYRDAKSAAIDEFVKPYMITLTQEQAGFEAVVEETILRVKIKPEIYKLIEIIKKKKVYTLRSGNTIVGDTPVKRQMICHQLCSGTIKMDDARQTLDESKAEFITSYFVGKKIAIFYKFIQEGEVIKKWFPYWTDDFVQFNKESHLTYVKQMVSGREGTDLQTADALVVYNIDFSATTYWQMRERMQNMVRKVNSKLYFIFSDRGIEDSIHKAVVSKKNYTLDYYKEYEKEMELMPTLFS